MQLTAQSVEPAAIAADGADIAAFVPDRAAGETRGLMHREFAAPILRGVQQDMESLETRESSVEEVSRQLRES